jgi:hypothetical protein
VNLPAHRCIGDAYRERARHDRDFDGVRSDPWFAALTR